MADVKHTPGPWEVNYTRFSQVTASNGALVATCEKLDGLTTLQANARLISAAPDLLEAAKLVIAWYEAENDHKGTDFWQRVAMCRESEDALRAAIAKATGAARATEGSAT